MSDKYEATGPEAEFEPGSRRRVLRNLLGIRSVGKMNQAESDALLAATNQLIDETTDGQRFTATRIREIHRRWLGKIYSWAGEYRSVNIAKSDFMFAAASEVPRLMRELEQGPLRTYTPLRADAIDAQSAALAVVHAELILIHPFREGNGRCARVLATLVALQAGLPPLDFSGIEGKEKRRYIGAIHAAMARDYEPMQEIFKRVIARSIRIALAKR